MLLPLLPWEPNRVRVLVVGGGDESKTSAGPDTAATDTAEIFDFDPTLPASARQAGWRSTEGSIAGGGPPHGVTGNPNTLFCR